MYRLYRLRSAYLKYLNKTTYSYNLNLRQLKHNLMTIAIFHSIPYNRVYILRRVFKGIIYRFLCRGEFSASLFTVQKHTEIEGRGSQLKY